MQQRKNDRGSQSDSRATGHYQQSQSDTDIQKPACRHFEFYPVFHFQPKRFTMHRCSLVPIPRVNENASAATNCRGVCLSQNHMFTGRVNGVRREVSPCRVGAFEFAAVVLAGDVGGAVSEHFLCFGQGLPVAPGFAAQIVQAHVRQARFGSGHAPQ